MGRVSWTFAQAQPDESVSARRSRNRISGVFLGSGAVLAFAALLVLPGWQVPNQTAMIIIGILIAGGSVSQIVFAAHVPIAMNHVTSIVGTATIAAAQLLAGYPIAIATVGLLYVWVAVFTSVFYSSFAATVHVAIMSAAQIAVLIYLQDPGLVPQVVVTIGTCITATIIVSWLTHDLRQQVSTDPLTSLPNRRGFEQIFAKSLAVATRTKDPLSVAVLDLDGFKALNDRHGHATGDEALIASADAWQDAIRPMDTLARTGGDEFVVLMPGCNSSASAGIITRLQAATPHEMTCSAGIAIFDGLESAADLLRRADSAMYAAKAKGIANLVVDQNTCTHATQ
ncbi:MAG: GGDEF domain-containing protein [Nakamurella sp.]